MITMRDLKIVAYGKLSENDERLTVAYLKDKGLRVQVLSVDTQAKRIRELERRIEELEAEDLPGAGEEANDAGDLPC